MSRKCSIVVGFAFLCALAACDPGQTVKDDTDPKTNLPTPSSCDRTEVLVNNKCMSPSEIKFDTVGYLVDRKKIATVPAGSATKFQLVDPESDEVAFEGDLGESTTNADTGDTTQLADFSEFSTEGKYVLRVEGHEDSPPFEIGQEVWNDTLRVTMLGLYGLRCGTKVEFSHQGTTFKHEACHKDDGIINGTFEGGLWSGGEKRDGTGGWHDAGDYGKYTVNASFALAFLLKAWEDFGERLGGVKHIPDYDGTLSPWLAEAKYQMDQLLEMQLSDGSAIHMLGPRAFPGNVLPETDTAPRYFTGVGTAATADLVAVAAMAARVFRAVDAEYADKCLAAAKAGQAFLDATPSVLSPSFDGFTHAAYKRAQDVGERFWALAELWRTTGDAALLTKVEELLPSTAKMNFDWGNVENLGLFTYVQASNDGRNAEKLASARASVVASADSLVTGADSHAYGRGIGTMYYWGVNGVLARSTLNLFVANQIAPDEKYLDAAALQVDHLLGRNPFGRSMLTGVGYLPANSPHHRPSQGDGIRQAWPGLLVGGPNPQDPDAAGKPPGLAWKDDEGDYYVNEIAINWNTALAYALAGFYK
ncbi:MAG: glycoside hydrolase family 9 protein [Polyangiaceae bacterium]